MKITKHLGIWMDHSIAHIMDFSDDVIITKIIASAFTQEVKVDSLDKSEHIMHNKQNQQQLAYYKQIGKIIENYQEVLLFGPTDAKKELFNLLSADPRFVNVKIDVKQTDKMTENQEHAFVRHYFVK